MKFQDVEVIAKKLIAMKTNCKNCCGWIACRDCQAKAKQQANYQQQISLVGEEQLQLAIKYISLQMDIAKTKAILANMQKEQASLNQTIQEKFE